MTQDLFEQWLIRTAEAAFSPLTARAEIWDYGERLKIKVLLPTPHEPHEYKHVMVEQARNQRQYLESVLEGERRKIQAKGVALNPWELPAAPSGS
jgi:hypothetical protein